MKYFVESLPETCEYCDCCHTKDYDNKYKIDGEKFCGIMNMGVCNHYDHNKYDNNGRPHWCPLREIPTEIEVFKDDWSDGYNACLKEMLE